MAYPKKLLSPDESIITEFRPHWTGILPVILLTLLVVAGAVVTVVFTDGRWTGYLLLGLLVVWVVASLRTFLRWFNTTHVVTNERVIHRTGILSKHGREIPLEMINSVSFSQNPFERMVKSGDLLIESAGETGQTHYSDIPRPEELQTLIYEAREKRMYQFEAAGKTSATPAEQLSILARLHDEGKLTDDEFEAQKRKLLG